jgi:hypothetical protein
MDEPTHNCPGCGQPGIHNRNIACANCWHDVPEDMKLWLDETYADRREYPTAYHAARAQIMAWLRQRKLGLL